jgi:hypothetical protein
MTQAKAKRKPRTKAPSKPNRTRARPRQIYLSKEEDAIFAAMLERYNVSASRLVRDWLWRAQAQFERRHVREPAPTDPRQLRIEDAAAAAN